MKRRSYVLIAIGVAILLAALLWRFDTLGGSCWDGAFKVPITLCRGGRILNTSEIRRVGYAWHFGDHEADWDALNLAESAASNFLASVPCSGSSSGLGFNRSRSQPHQLYIRIECADGRVVEITTPLADRPRQSAITIDLGEKK